MYTYQDLQEVGELEEKRQQFVKAVIEDHIRSEEYNMAVIAEDYFKRRNTTIRLYQKFLTKITGEIVPDYISANYKLSSNFYGRFTTQLTQYLLGNGITWEKKDTKDKLGDKFERRIQDATTEAQKGGKSFGYWNLDHLEVWSLLEFAPIVDELDGSIKAGVRFWQLKRNKPLKATFYELDGFTKYMWEDGKPIIEQEKRPYILNIKYTENGGDEVIEGRNYPSFPIIPLYADSTKQSTLVGLRENIDAYDLIKSGFCNSIDEASIVYWTINNAGGMDDVDLVQFTNRIKTLHAMYTDDGATATPNTIDAPFEGREALLTRLRADLYEDAMALDTKNIADGAVTATQIRASYEPLNSKADELEYNVTEFIEEILKLANIDDTPTYTRSKIVNVQEEIETLVTASQYLNDEYIAKKIVTLLGDADKVEEVLSGLVEDRLLEYGNGTGNTPNAGEETVQ